MRKSKFDLFLLLIVLLIFVGYVLYPLLMAVVESFQFQGEFSFKNYLIFFNLENKSNLEALWNSILLSLSSVLLSGIFGTALAYVITEFEFPLKRFFSRLAVLPIALPPLVGVIAFLFLYGESGILPRGLKAMFGFSQVPFALEGFSAVLLVHAYSFYVYFYLFVSTALQRIDPALTEASANLGSNRWRTFWKIIVPLLTPALVGASLLTFMASMASFSAPLLFAGQQRFMTLQIYNAKLNGDLNLAATHSVILTLISILFLIVLRVYSSRKKYVMAVKGISRRARTFDARYLKTGIYLFIFAAAAFILLPLLTILLISFVKEGSWTWQIFPTQYTGENYLELITEPSVLQPIINSLEMALLATAANVLFGVVVAYLAAKGSASRFFMKRILEIFSILPFAIPGTVIALNLILAFNKPTVFSANQILIGTFWILPLAYFIRNIPLVIRATMAAFEQLDQSLEEAAQNLGAGMMRSFRKILLPLILPAIVSGALLTFIASMGEFVSSILLYTYANRPISVEILSQLRLYNFGAASAYGVFLLVFITLASFLATGIFRPEKYEAKVFVF